ncbi:MAG: hypothetical protein HQM10_02990 [Candidatus Riflebacteria bacterium]|nr:hypothetical protein [Candidatus Riflebacteria bacterium]
MDVASCRVVCRRLEVALTFLRPKLLIRCGFSFVELLIVSVILLLALTTFFKFFQQRSSSEQSITGQLSLQMEARKAVDAIVKELRDASEILRPGLGETSACVVFADSINQVGLISPTYDVENSLRLKKDLYKIFSFVQQSPPSVAKKEKILATSVGRVAFTLLAPNVVQVNITISNEKGEYQLLTAVGLMNFGEEE